MGKKLIIQGADFSENGFSLTTELYPSWTENQAIVADETLATFGNILSSINFKVSNKLNIEGYSVLTYTKCTFTKTGGGSSGFGTVFYDSSNNPISGDVIPAGDRGVTVVTIEIPINATSVAFTYFKESAVDFSALVE